MKQKSMFQAHFYVTDNASRGGSTYLNKNMGFLHLEISQLLRK